MLAVCFAATWDIHLLIPFFKPKNTFLKSIITKNNIFTYTHLSCTFNQQKKPYQVFLRSLSMK